MRGSLDQSRVVEGLGRDTYDFDCSSSIRNIFYLYYALSVYFHDTGRETFSQSKMSMGSFTCADILVRACWEHEGKTGTMVFARVESEEQREKYSSPCRLASRS